MLHLPRVAAEPFIIQPDVGCYPVSIAEEMAEVPMRLRFSRGSVIIGIFGRQAGFRVTGLVQISSASVRSFFPESPVLFIRLQGK
ncbi:hypothetical protein D3C71_2073940 [compost metagenome]